MASPDFEAKAREIAQSFPGATMGQTRVDFLVCEITQALREAAQSGAEEMRERGENVTMRSVIELEKRILKSLGREWTPANISLMGLVHELADKYDAIRALPLPMNKDG